MWLVFVIEYILPSKKAILVFRAYHSGRLRTPFEYCNARIPLRRSMVGYNAKKAGYAAMTSPK